MSADVKGVKGFTIIEVLIALAIFGIGILAVAKMQISATGHNTSSRVYTEAATTGAGQVEELINYFYDDLATGTGTAEDVGPNGIYELNWSIDDVGEDFHHIKRIHITVTSEKEPDRTFETTTYKAITY